MSDLGATCSQCGDITGQHREDYAVRDLEAHRPCLTWGAIGCAKRGRQHCLKHQHREAHQESICNVSAHNGGETSQHNPPPFVTPYREYNERVRCEPHKLLADAEL